MDKDKPFDDNLFDEFNQLKNTYGLEGFAHWYADHDDTFHVDVMPGSGYTRPHIEEFRVKAMDIIKKYYPTRPDKLPDTGERREFGTGAVRDASKGKGHFHSIPPIALRKLAKRFEDGAAKYEKNNYLKGMNLTAFVDSINRHFLAIQEGASDEDHYGALLWNVAVMLWTDEGIKAGRLPKELDDLPYRAK